MPRLSVSKDGTITAIYSDELVGLAKQGAVEIVRASNVEPDANGRWIVTMAPEFGGVKLSHAWDKREDALKAEVAYLDLKLFQA